MATGYLRYGEAFRKLHNNDMCVNPSCELLNCIQGIQLLANGTLNIKDANLFHSPNVLKKNGLESLKVDNQKTLERLSDIEKILEEKEHLDERKNLFENKLKHLKKKLNPFKMPCWKSRSETKRWEKSCEKDENSSKIINNRERKPSERLDHWQSHWINKLENKRESQYLVENEETSKNHPEKILSCEECAFKTNSDGDAQ